MNTHKCYSGNVAYTTPSGRMHIGHGLGQVTTDAAIRFSAMDQGKKPFFPFGIHSTGRDLVKIISQLTNTEGLAENLKKYNISPNEREIIISGKDLDSKVDRLVSIYKEQYQNVLTKLGTCIDFETFFSSHQPENHKFTQWTLKRLNDKGLICSTRSQRAYCSDCDEVKAIEKDLSEVVAKGKIDWEGIRIENGELLGGNFFCRLHNDTKISVSEREERAIDYANPVIQAKTLELLKDLKVFPEKHAVDIAEIIKTRRAKPFERKPFEMVGAISPFDESKKVEALADSNIYMEFFPVAKMINRGEISLNNLTDDLFDYIYLGKGNLESVAKKSNLSTEKVKNLERTVAEICPFDLSVIGFEHKDVHLPFSLFTHAAILPENYFFKEYLITGHITHHGEKMSKSKGNVVFLDELIKLVETEGQIEGISNTASLDSLRFFLSYYQYLDKDFDWDTETFKAVGLAGTRRFVKSNLENQYRLNSLAETDNLSSADKWLSTINERAIIDYTHAMRSRNHRNAMIIAVDNMNKMIREYLHINSNPNKIVLENVLKTQNTLVSPVMPRIASELRSSSEEDLRLPSPNLSNIYSEEFEMEQHRILGQDYLTSYRKEIISQIGKLKGRKQIGPGSEIIIALPSEYSLKMLRDHQIYSGGEYKTEFLVDPSLRNISIKSK